MCRNKQTVNHIEFYKKFWHLQDILCNRDYLIKAPEQWGEFKRLMEYVLQEMGKIKDVISSEEKDMSDMNDQLNVVMHDIDETGTFGEFA